MSAKAEAAAEGDGREAAGALSGGLSAEQSATFNRRIAAVALPTVATMLSEPLLTMVDTAFVGRLGVEQIAGVGLAGFVFKALGLLFSFFVAVTTSATAAAGAADAAASAGLSSNEGGDGGGVAESEFERAARGASPPRPPASSALSRAVADSLMLALIIGVLLGAFLLFAAPTALSLLAGSASAAVLPYAVQYLRVRAVSAPLLIVSYALTGAFRGVQDTLSPFRVALASNVANVILAYTMIFVLHWGVVGAAVATNVAQLLAVTMLLQMLLSKGVLRSPTELLRWPSAAGTREMLRGSVLSLRSLNNLAAYAFASKLSAMMGAASVASFEIGKSLWTMMGIVCNGLSVTAQTLLAPALAGPGGGHAAAAAAAAAAASVAEEQQRKKSGTESVPVDISQAQIEQLSLYSDACALAARLVRLALLLGAAISLLCAACSPWVTNAFTTDVAVRQMTAASLRVMSLALPFLAYRAAVEGVFAAARQYTFQTLAAAVSAAVSIGALSLVAARRLPFTVPTVWLAINVLTWVHAATLALRYHSAKHTPVPPVDDARLATAAAPAVVNASTKVSPPSSPSSPRQTP